MQKGLNRSFRWSTAAAAEGRRGFREGRGQFDGDDCPACGGEGEMPRGWADELDLRQYKKVMFPLCPGRHDECRFCDGADKAYKGAADEFEPLD